MATSSYPERNPFPIQATASVDSKDRDKMSLAANVVTPQMKRAKGIVDTYLDARVQRQNSPDGILACYGPPGSGKTHTLRYLVALTAQQCTERKQLFGLAYVLAGMPNVNSLQYAIIKELSLETLRAVSQRFIEVIGLEHLESQTVKTTAGEKARANLRENLPKIGELIKEALIDPSEVNKRQAEEFLDPGDDFKNVISYLDDEKLGEKAREWLCGEPIDPDTLDRLGVTGKRSPTQHARQTLRLIIRLFKRAGVPLLVFLDQCENFLRSGPQGTMYQKSVDFLQWFVETRPEEQYFVAAAMSREAWKELPSHIRQRFSLNTVSFSVLSENDAREFIYTYVQGKPPEKTADEDTDGSSTNPVDTFPFEPDAVRRILEATRGNLRGFLQVCHHAFKEAAPKSERITEETVDKALGAADRESPSSDQVVKIIAGLLRDRGLDLAESVKADASAAMRASREIQARTGRSLAFLEVSEALFIDDEARQSLETLNVVQRALADPRTLPVIVVVVGYASPEILARLKLATPHVLVYEPGKFAKWLGDTLDKIQVAATGPTPSAASLESKFTELRNELVGLLQTRTEDAQRTAGFATDVVDKQEIARIQDLWRTARVEWSKERKGIEAQIKSARIERAKQELETLEWERSRAVKERVQRSALLWLAGVAIGIPALAFARSWSQLDWLEAFGFFIYRPASFVFAAVGVLGFGIQLYGLPGPVRALWGRVRSIEELNDLSARYARKKRPQRRHLLSNNPQLRYAAALSLPKAPDRDLIPDNKKPSPDWLFSPVYQSDVVVAQKTEVNATVRRSLAWYAGREREHPGEWPESVYAFEREGLSFVFGRTLSPVSFELIDSVGADEALKDAFDRGISEQNWSALNARRSVPRIQGVMRELSPLERPGLGTFDYLQDVAEIDGLYLFFRQWMHFIELDLPMTRLVQERAERVQQAMVST